MPQMDQTGPVGMGPGTGRGWGRCMGYNIGGQYRRGLGRFFSPWRFAGRDERVKDLEEYKKALLEELEEVEKTLKNPDPI